MAPISPYGFSIQQRRTKLCFFSFDPVQMSLCSGNPLSSEFLFALTSVTSHQERPAPPAGVTLNYVIHYCCFAAEILILNSV